MNSVNGTSEDTNIEFSVFMNVIECLIIMIAFIGNIFVVIAHLKDPLKCFQTSSAQFILNIAVVDLIATTSIAIILLHKFLNDKNNPDEQRLLFFPISLSFPSFFILSVERFCSVAFPLWHRTKVSIHSCRKCLLGLWLFHVIYEVINFVIECVTNGKFTAGCIRLIYVFFFFISTQAFYLASCLSLRKQNQQIIARQQNGENSFNHNNQAMTRDFKIRLLNEKRFLITIAIVCLILALTVLPSIIYYKVVQLIFPEIVDLEVTGRILILLLRVNFMVNPLIYLWRLKNYRKTLKDLCCSC